jgi:hypothetical protein
LGCIFARLDGEAFRRCFAAWKKAEGIEDDAADGDEYAGPLPWKVAVAEDGKAARGSRRRKGGNKVMTMVSAFGVRTRTVLAQAKVDQKSNEITAIPKLRRYEARHPSKEPISMRRRRKKASRSDTFLMEAIL